MGAGGAAGDRGVEHGDALVSRSGRDSLRRFRIDGAAVDGERPLRQTIQNALLQVEPGHMLAGGQHADEDIDVRCGI